MASGLYVGNTGIGMVRVGVFSSNGVDTSDATATASNIESGKTAYVNGNKITGTLSTASRVGYAPLISNDATVTESKHTDTLGNTHTMIQITATSATAPSGKAIINPSSTEVFVEANPSDFGNATAADVTSGKTFTSSAGLKVTGTRTSSSGSSGSGIDTSDATASASDILSGKTAYVNGSKVTGTIKSKAAATITPGTASQTIAAGQYLAGAQTIEGDGNLSAGNIKKGVSIFGVSGTLETGSTGTDTSDATAESGDILERKTAYIASGKVTGTLSTAPLVAYTSGNSGSGDASVSEISEKPMVGSSYKKIRVKAPSVTSVSGKAVVDPSNVKIQIEVGCSDFGNAVAANVLSGKTFTASPGLKVKGTMASKEAETITPGVDDQTIASGQYLAGVQTIKGDSNLIAGNIKKGVSIFGVTGTLETGSTGTDTSDATATASDILSGKTAYVKGEKVTGTISSKAAATYTPGTLNQTIASGQYLSGVQTIKGDSNLTAENIKSGVSIFGVEGTYAGTGGSGSGNNNCEAYVITSTSATVSFKNTSGTIKVFGYGKTTSSSGWGSSTSVLAFCGDKYYKSVSYGSPTSTSLSLSINSDGTISGLPSMTECNLLVTRGV